jgi:hypothetical protein
VVAASGSEFISIANNNELSSKLIGLDIYNNSKQNTGQIKNGDKSAGPRVGHIVSVCGFLRMGERYVAQIHHGAYCSTRELEQATPRLHRRRQHPTRAISTADNILAPIKRYRLATPRIADNQPEIIKTSESGENLVARAEGSSAALVLSSIWRGGTPGVLPTEPFSIGGDRLANWRHRSGLGG